jgi:hypothetical protein
MQGFIFKKVFANNFYNPSNSVVLRKPIRDYQTPRLSYGPPWAHCLGGYQDRLLGGPLGLPGLRYTVPEGVEHKDSTGVVLG